VHEQIARLASRRKVLHSLACEVSP
jgi:hypothetical protein